ncbi:ubiquinone biosynthesis protein COQ4 [Alphaproteobacteria bacterium]|nr:ubiquinone biosynthesis protein COQ4 [Alphaproteobacteria bacterium]MDC0148368.1 ubiquinone biosynthesis protein COQ4 [Alphaproteobacteria bacterium]
MKKPGKISRALTAIRKLIEDKEDTTQVFVILEALAGKSGERSFQRFMKTPNAKKILTAEKPLMDYLQDREWLASLPEGSLGRTYLNFTKVEQITADGLVEASQDVRSDQQEFSKEAMIYQDRQRDAHDLWHVVTGYGRDALGELSLLAVTWRQTGNLGFLLIIGFGFWEVAKAAPEIKIAGVLREGFRTGAASEWLPSADWETLLTRPLDEVRASLKMPAPTRYRRTVEKFPEIKTAVNAQELANANAA